jgi:hypothetical protein
MTLDEQKEQFSFAYVRAVAAVAQVAATKPTIDDDSIDLNFRMRGGGGIRRSPQIDAQVKCTETVALNGPNFSFTIKIKNYDELRPTDVLVPRILVVVTVPQLLGEWLDHSEEELAMRKCGYWLSLRGLPDSGNMATVTLRLPRANQFTVAALQAMMDRVGNNQAP